VRTLVIIALPVVASLCVAGCGSGQDVPLVRYQVRLESSARTPEDCGDSVDVAFDPVRIAPQVEGNLYRVQAFTYVAASAGRPVQDGPGAFECWYDYLSPALAPGKWKITGEFSNGSMSCLRDVGPGAVSGVAIDQEDGCADLEPKAAARPPPAVLRSAVAGKSANGSVQ
jgi:hypothetical protein